jgi:hypothetical protein
VFGKIMFTRIALLTLGLVVPATAEIRLEGVMSGPKSTLFALSNDGGQVRWLRIGDTFGQFSVASYNAREEALTLRNDANEVVLRLPTAIIRSAGGDIVGAAERLQGLDLVFALALAGDEEMTEGVGILKKSMDDTAALEKLVEQAQAELAASKSDHDRVKVGSLLRQLDTRVKLEAILRRRLIDAASAKMPNR